MDFTLNPGAVFVALIVVIFLFCLLRGLKTEGCFSKVFVLVILVIIVSTIFIAKGG